MAEQLRLISAIEGFLDEAVAEGRRIASDGSEITSNFSGTATRARDIVSGTIRQLKGKVTDLFASIPDDEETTHRRRPPSEPLPELPEGIAKLRKVRNQAKLVPVPVKDVEEIADWIDDYGEMVAITEIHSAVEEAIADTWQEQGVTQIWWQCEIAENVCERCLANMEASPINLGDAFPDGSACPPAHPRCRCSLEKY